MKGKKPFNGGPVLYYSFRKTIQGVLVIGEVNHSIGKPKGNRLSAVFTRDKVCSPGVNGAETRSRSIYA